MNGEHSIDFIVLSHGDQKNNCMPIELHVENSQIVFCPDGTDAFVNTGELVIVQAQIMGIFCEDTQSCIDAESLFLG